MLYAIRSGRMYKLITYTDIILSNDLDKLLNLSLKYREGIIKNQKGEMLLYFKR